MYLEKTVLQIFIKRNPAPEAEMPDDLKILRNEKTGTIFYFGFC